MNPNLCQLNKFELNDDGLNLVDVQTSSLEYLMSSIK